MEVLSPWRKGVRGNDTVQPVTGGLREGFCVNKAAPTHALASDSNTTYFTLSPRITDASFVPMSRSSGLTTASAPPKVADVCSTSITAVSASIASLSLTDLGPDLPDHKHIQCYSPGSLEASYAGLEGAGAAAGPAKLIILPCAPECANGIDTPPPTPPSAQPQARAGNFPRLLGDREAHVSGPRAIAIGSQGFSCSFGLFASASDKQSSRLKTSGGDTSSSSTLMASGQGVKPFENSKTAVDSASSAADVQSLHTSVGLESRLRDVEEQNLALRRLLEEYTSRHQTLEGDDDGLRTSTGPSARSSTWTGSSPHGSSTFHSSPQRHANMESSIGDSTPLSMARQSNLCVARDSPWTAGKKPTQSNWRSQTPDLPGRACEYSIDRGRFSAGSPAPSPSYGRSTGSDASIKARTLPFASWGLNSTSNRSPAGSFRPPLAECTPSQRTFGGCNTQTPNRYNLMKICQNLPPGIDAGRARCAETGMAARVSLRAGGG